jgi:diguanylate cyclase
VTDSSALDRMDFEYATTVAEKAMRLMAEQRVLPTPQNFQVWFKYSLGTSADLTRTINILIGNKRKFDAATSEELFRTYVGPQVVSIETVLNNASEQLHDVLISAKQFLARAVADNQEQIRAITDVADRTGTGDDPKLLIENLMEELTKAIARATELEAGFGEKSRELDAIRDSLSKSEQRAKTDMLTGLPNRHALDEFFRSAQMEAMEKGTPLGVLLIDIDHFKKFNDDFGHAVGDQVLRLVATALRERVREIDLPARYGGEEMIVVLPGADLATCKKVAERIRQSISEREIIRRSTGEVLRGITVSIGVGQFQFGEGITDLIDRCDRALYHAKKTGRNRIVTEDQLHQELAVV